jgi:AmiR/NasT family two-component response regulator
MAAGRATLRNGADAMTDGDIQQLRDEITRLLADALQVAADLGTESDRVQQAHDEEVTNLKGALESRDIIGQAKGIIMVTMHCDADKAFGLLATQSQVENRKVVDIAREIAGHVSRRARPI